MPKIDPHKLPGAILFVKIKEGTKKGTNARTFLAVIYDPNFKGPLTLVELRQRLVNNAVGSSAHYFEEFKVAPTFAMSCTDRTTDHAFRVSGIFGKNKADASSTWESRFPSNADNSEIVSGFYMTYWNNGTDWGRGVHTSNATAKFGAGQLTNMMHVYPGNSANLLAGVANLQADYAESLVLEWYATFDNDQHFETQTLTAFSAAK